MYRHILRWCGALDGRHCELDRELDRVDTTGAYESADGVREGLDESEDLDEVEELMTSADAIKSNFDFTPNAIAELNEHCGVMLLPEAFLDLSDEDQIRSILRAGICARHGIVEGEDLNRQLYR